MFTVLLALLNPDASACSVAQSVPEASFPVDAAQDAALNQRLLIEYGGAFPVESSVVVFDVGGIVEQEIPGSSEFVCATHDIVGECVLIFEPESGFWPSDGSIAWTVYDGDDGEGQPLLSGSFQTTDWASAGQSPENVSLDGEWLEFYAADGMCIGADSLSGNFQLSATGVEAGSVIELWMEREGESSLASVRMVEEGSEIDLELDVWRAASDAESCFEAVFIAPDGAEAGRAEGPCLQWPEEIQEDPNGENERLFCATATGSGRSSSLLFGLMGLLTIVRRQRR